MTSRPTRLFVLPCDHRDILRDYWSSYRPSGFVDGDQWITYAKQLILDGLLWAVERGADIGEVALLMDEELGAPVLERARDMGITRFVPADDGTVGPYVLQYAGDFSDHIRSIDPDYVQTLINYNPASPEAPTQMAAIQPLLDWLVANPRPMMLELQVLPTDTQLEQHGREAFIRDIRPGLMRQAIADFHGHGANPDVWKVEPLPDLAEYSSIVSAIRSDGRSHAVAVVLGGGASIEDVDASIELSAGVDGFVGFAVGRSVWADGIEQKARGEISAAEATKLIGETFLHFVQVYVAAQSVTA